MTAKIERVALVAMFLCLAACAAPGSEHVANVAITLQSSSSSGAVYRLEQFAVQLAGPTTVTLSSDDQPDGAPSMDAWLPAGTYSASVQPGWVLTRVVSGVSTPVAAQIVQPNPTFVVGGGQRATVTFAFRLTNGETTVGGVDVGFTVDDGPVVASTFATSVETPQARAITGDSLGNTYVAFAGADGNGVVRGYGPVGQTRFVLSYSIPSADTDADVDLVVAPDATLRVVVANRTYVYLYVFDTNTGSLVRTRSWTSNSLTGINSVLINDGRCRVEFAGNGAFSVVCSASLGGVGAAMISPTDAILFTRTNIMSGRVRDNAATRGFATAFLLESGRVSILSPNGQLVLNNVGAAITTVAAGATEVFHAVDGSVVRTLGANGAMSAPSSLPAGYAGRDVAASGAGFAIATYHAASSTYRLRRYDSAGTFETEAVIPYALSTDVEMDLAYEDNRQSTLAFGRGAYGFGERIVP